MEFYQEITLIEQAEISPYFIWSKLYGQLHIALVEMDKGNSTVEIGVSFPQYIYRKKDEHHTFKASLGKKLRIFAQSEKVLNDLDIRKWLERLTDYLHITSVRMVPKSVNSYAIYKRKQVKTNAQRLARHRVKRGDIGFDEALARYRHVVTTTDLPYIQMVSLSSSTEQDKNQFKLFIEKKTMEKGDFRNFSSYGLSAVGVVPEF